MRVLLVGPEWIGRWTESTQKALADLGHDVQISYYNSLRVEQVAYGLGRRLGQVSPMFSRWLGDYRVRWERAMNQRLREVVRLSNPDLVLILKGDTLELETIATLRRSTKKCLVTWWLDDPLGSRLPKEAIPFYNTFFLFDKSYFGPLSTAGAAEVQFLPCCCDPSVFRPVELDTSERVRYGCDVSFVGVYYPNRGHILEQTAGLKVNIWGPLWDSPEAQSTLERIGVKSWHGKFADQAKSLKIYNASQVCLNIHHSQTRLGGLNLRTFEVLASGAFLLTDRVAGMDELLIPGEEVACYSSPDQVRAQVGYYLAHPDERLRISQRGRARVLREHTYRHRMQTILQKLGLTDQ